LIFFGALLRLYIVCVWLIDCKSSRMSLGKKKK
jgi:hypothetical protein